MDLEMVPSLSFENVVEYLSPAGGIYHNILALVQQRFFFRGK